MSLINEYRATEQAIKELSARLSSLKGDEALQKELEFEGKVRELMGQYGKSLRDIMAILDPEFGKRAPNFKQTGNTQTVKSRRQRKVKQYKNPHTDEVIETKGGNHKTLKEWKAQWGADEVESWSTISD